MSQSPLATGTPRTKSMTEREDGHEGRETRGSILLFEDDDNLASLLARVLRSDGYQVDLLERADVPAAAKLARYDVVLSDIHLADGTSGHDVLKKVRETSEH